MSAITLQFDTAADLESALLDALQNNEGHFSGIAAYLAQDWAEAVAPEAKPNWNERSHLAHCFQGEYLHSCKYGDDECPAAPPAPPSPHRRSRPNE